MGTDIDIIVVDEQPPLAALISIHLLFEQEEPRFSRFLPDSLVSRLNSGSSVTDGTLAEVCRLALTASDATGGLFNPMVLPALLSAGYDRAFEEVSGGRLDPTDVPLFSECISIKGDDVRLIAGTLNLGGIVKGWTTDQSVELLAEDHPNLLVNAGGDLRVHGSEDNGDGWNLSVEDPRDPAVPAWSGRVTGSLATSTTLKRSWTTSTGGAAHHLIDPRTGLPSASDLVQVSVWAKDVWWAEVWAKAILIGGPSVATQARSAGYEVLVLGGATS